jgi:hypothetical protein
LIRYAPNGTYFARIRLGGKLIRQSPFGMVPLPQIKPSSQIFAGCELTKPRSGPGNGAEPAG